MSALHIVHLLLRANVPAQHTRQTNVFAATRGDKMAMWLFANLVWTLIYIPVMIYAAVPRAEVQKSVGSVDVEMPVRSTIV